MIKLFYRTGAVFTWGLATAAVFAFAACKDTSRPSVSAEAHLLTVRGQVTQVPSSRPGSQFMVHHEAIPGFVDETGAVVGMESMTMYMPTAKGLSLAAIAPGDKIEFILSIDWPQNKVEITQITKLPPETQLDFESPVTPSDSVASGSGN